MALGLGASLNRTGLVTPGIVTDNLVMKHMYPAGAVQPVSDGAAYFGGAGTEDRITITETEFSVHDAAHTFAFWAKRNVLGVSHTILGHTSVSTHKRLTIDSSNNFLIESDTDGDAATVTLNTVDTEWHHYALTVTGSGSTIVAYQDGVLCSDSGDVASNNMTINIIGAADSGGTEKEFDGYLCNIGIWEAVLTQPQVKSIM